MARVALLISADSWRGAGVSYAKIARGLAAHGHVPHLLTTCDIVRRRFGELGLPVSELPLRRTGVRDARTLRRALRSLGAEILIADRPRDVRLGAMVAAGGGPRLVSRYNRHAFRVPDDVATRLAYRVGLVRCTVFQTEWGRDAVLAAAPFMRRAPSRVIWNGVDAERFRPDPAAGARYRSAQGLGEGPLLLSVAALAPEKRHDVVIRAAARLPAPRPPLHVCGAGPAEAELRALAAELGVAATFRGLLPHEELRGAFNAATVVVHAAPGEGFGGSVLEALACGRPVVGPDAAAVPEIIGRDGTAGVLVPPGDPDATGAAVAALLADPARAAALGRAARERALRDFTLEQMAARYDALVRDILGAA